MEPGSGKVENIMPTFETFHLYSFPSFTRTPGLKAKSRANLIDFFRKFENYQILGGMDGWNAAAAVIIMAIYTWLLNYGYLYMATILWLSIYGYYIWLLYMATIYGYYIMATYIWLSKYGIAILYIVLSLIHI